MILKTKKPGIAGFLLQSCRCCGLTLGVLRTLAGLVETDLLALYSTCIAGYEACLAELCLEGLVVLHESTGDAQTDCAGLAGDSAALDGDLEVELVGHGKELKRLPDYHAGGLAAEILLKSPAVDFEFAGTYCREDTSGRALAAAGAIKLIVSHDCLR